MKDVSQKIIGTRVQQLRQDKGWTQAELAEKANLERKSITRYENGTSTPKSNVVSTLASIFGVTTDYLLGLSDEPLPIPRSESNLTPLELEAIQALRRARTDDQRVRLLDALKALISSDAP